MNRRAALQTRCRQTCSAPLPRRQRSTGARWLPASAFSQTEKPSRGPSDVRFPPIAAPRRTCRLRGGLFFTAPRSILAREKLVLSKGGSIPATRAVEMLMWRCAASIFVCALGCKGFECARSSDFWPSVARSVLVRFVDAEHEVCRARSRRSGGRPWRGHCAAASSRILCGFAGRGEDEQDGAKNHATHAAV